MTNDVKMTHIAFARFVYFSDVKIFFSYRKVLILHWMNISQKNCPMTQYAPLVKHVKRSKMNLVGLVLDLKTYGSF